MNKDGGDWESPCQQLRGRTLSVDLIRAVDRMAVERFGMHSLVLMENAAVACARWLDAWPKLRRRITHRTLTPIPKPFTAVGRAAILCGRGNNGGDGLAIARHLRAEGWHCDVFVLGPLDGLSSDALANLKILTAVDTCGATIVDAEAASHKLVSISLDAADVVVDAMLGSGARGAPRPPLDRWIDRANAAAALRVAIDIPTGLDAANGEVAGTVLRADVTLTFVALKPGFHQLAARRVLGEVIVMPIGIPVEMIRELLNQSEPSELCGGS